ncbi:MAG: FAD-binding domain-containing protein [Myxococcota bacterium]
MVWLKRDLRLEDHAALTAAARQGPVALLYVFEPSLLARPEIDASHVAFVLGTLAALEQQLAERGVALWVELGEVVDVLDRLHHQHRFEALYAHEETGLFVTWDRDRAVARWARRTQVSFHEYPQFGVFRPHPSRDGWAERWERRMRPGPLPVPEIGGPPRSPRDLPRLEDLGVAPSLKVDGPAPGRGAGVELLDSFLERRGRRYASEMSSPVTAVESCSLLSPHLAYGTLSMREVRQASGRRREAALARKDADWAGSLDAFEARLRWHCHFIQKLEDEPELEFHNAHRGYDGLRNEAPLDAWSASERRRLRAWIEGRTGYPMVDAAMRHLHRTGWINFRMRAMLVSFACHHLWLHWREPAVALAAHFVDFEPGIHFSQFQMQAGTTGINTPRIYNVLKQAEEQDPEGLFIRRELPELEGVPNAYLPCPGRMPTDLQRRTGCKIGRDYPPPIVEHGTAMSAARQRLEGMKRRPELRAEAERVVARHGSRKSPTGAPRSTPGAPPRASHSRRRRGSRTLT